LQGYQAENYRCDYIDGLLLYLRTTIEQAADEDAKYYMYLPGDKNR